MAPQIYEGPEASLTRAVSFSPPGHQVFSERRDFDVVADRAWRDLKAELPSEPAAAVERRLPDSAELVMRGVVEWLREWGNWRTGAEIVGCRLRDRAGITMARVPYGADGWRLLDRLVREGRVERRTRQRGRRDTYFVYRAPGEGAGE